MLAGCDENDHINEVKTAFNEKEVNIPDKKNIEILSNGYAKDAITAYCGGKQIPNSDAKSFMVINQYCTFNIFGPPKNGPHAFDLHSETIF